MNTEKLFWVFIGYVFISEFMEEQTKKEIRRVVEKVLPQTKDPDYIGLGELNLDVSGVNDQSLEREYDPFVEEAQLFSGVL